MPKRERMRAEQRREANASYMRKWRANNPDACHNNNYKVVAAPSIRCECGGSYKDLPQTRRRHFETEKHQCWCDKQEVMKMFIEVGKHSDKDESSSRIDAYCEQHNAYTIKQKTHLYSKMKWQLSKQLDDEKSKEREEEVKPHRPLRESHAEKVICMAQETARETEEAKEQPENVVVELSELSSSSFRPSTSE